MFRKDYKDGKLFSYLLKFNCIGYTLRAVPIALIKCIFLYFAIIFNGFNLPFLNRFSKVFTGEVYPFFSTNTLIFTLKMLIMYIIALWLRNIYGHRALNRTIEIYLEKPLWKRDEKTQKELEKHYKNQQNYELQGPLTRVGMTTAICRDLDYVSMLWTAIFFPIMYAYEAVITEAKMLYPYERSLKISYRVGNGLKMSRDRLWTFTTIMFVLNKIIPIILCYYIYKNNINDKNFQIFVLSYTLVMNSITYMISKFKYLSFFIAYNPLEIDSSKLKESKKKNPFNWAKRIKESIELFNMPPYSEKEKRRNNKNRRK